MSAPSTMPFKSLTRRLYLQRWCRHKWSKQEWSSDNRLSYSYKAFHTPFERLHYLKGEFDSLYNLIIEGEGDAAPLKNKVERLIHQACDLKDLQESYSDQLTTDVWESLHTEVGNKLNGATHYLDAKSTRYNPLKAKLGQVNSRCKELLKEFQSLDDRKKDLSCQVVARKVLLQEAKRAVIDLKGLIDTLNAIEVIDLVTKASLDKIEAYIKEFFEDLKTFQWVDIDSLCVYYFFN